jgi:hypothetical protein
VLKSTEETSEMRYILGTLSPAEMDRIDEAFFQEDSNLQELEQELEIAETELIDLYVRNQLSAAARKRFADRIQKSPALLGRVKFAETLKNKVAESVVVVVEPAPEPRTSWWRQLFAQPAFAAAVAAGCVVIIGGGVPLIIALRSVHRESNQIAAERSVLIEENKQQHQQSTELKAKADQLEADLRNERDQREEDRKLIEQLQQEAKKAPANIASIFLMPGTLRSSGTGRQLTLSPGTKTVQLKLSIEPANYSSYSVSVESDGGVVFSQDRLKAQRHTLIVSIPTRRISPGDYLVTVKGVRALGQIDTINNYQFRILQPR